jgi:hypothetical protein
VDLATHQRALLSLLVPGASTADGLAADAYADPYIGRIAGSEELDVVREIGDSWRRFSLRRLCPLTWRLLEQTGTLELHLVELAARPGLSPFLELLADQFLDAVAHHTDRLEVALASFELALLRARTGTGPVPGSAPPVDVVIEWPRDPEEVLRCLLAGEAVGAAATGRFVTRAPASSPAAFTIQHAG